MHIKSKSLNLPGAVNGAMVGIIIKEMVRRAMTSIARNRASFEAKEKQSHYKTAQDFLTNADTEAQEIYLKTIRECFPDFGIIAEEDELSIPCKLKGTDIYFTVDPLDGTKAFMRRQSHGIGTMISLVHDGEVIAAVVGDIMTQEMYYFRPGSKKVHRSTWRDDIREVLKIKPAKLSDQYVLLDTDIREYPLPIQRLTLPGKVFRNTECSGGSIGVKMARLWKGEVGAILLRPSKVTPWDWCPLVGILKRLGFVMLRNSSGQWKRGEIIPSKEIGDQPDNALIIHSSVLAEFRRYSAPGDLF